MVKHFGVVGSAADARTVAEIGQDGDFEARVALMGTSAARMDERDAGGLSDAVYQRESRGEVADVVDYGGFRGLVVSAL